LNSKKNNKVTSFCYFLMVSSGVEAENSNDPAEKKQEQLFDPPLWRQRRVFASQTIQQNPSIHSVLDIGCGEGALLQILLNDTKYSEIAGLDVDLKALALAEDSCAPGTMDHKYLRELPVHLTLYYGSITTVDARLQKYDCITMLEVIEHMDDDVLGQVPKVVFGIYQPELVIISTPNAEFNVHFPNLMYGTAEQQFRHWDHRFEWTREEFENWSHKLI
jgi:2-polyprenyl-3-methyl-5-hydroxy-6-metoxy-1,4-benzoquinol methylase